MNLQRRSRPPGRYDVIRISLWLKAFLEDEDREPGEVLKLRKTRWMLGELCAQIDQARQEVDDLRRVAALAEVEVALTRSWCKLCRTEGLGEHRGRDVHPHDPGCILAARAAATNDAPKEPAS